MMRQTLFIAFLFFSLSTFAQEGFKGEHFIEVTGTAETEIDPNEITVHIRLKEFEENRAIVQLEKIEKEFLAALKSANIDKKRLALADAGATLTGYGRKDRDKDALRQKTYQLVFTSGPELENFLQKAEPVKIDRMVITRVHHTDYEKIKLDLKIKALQAAKAKAEALVRGIGSEIGKPLMIREWDNEPHPIDINNGMANVMMKQQNFESDASPVEETAFKKIRMRSQVSAQFEIK